MRIVADRYGYVRYEIKLVIYSVLLGMVLETCALLPNLLTTITAVATTVSAVLQEIQKVSDGYFVAHPDDTRQTDINALIDATRSASLTALDSAREGTDIGNKDALAALAQLQKMYSDLLAMVKDIGVAVAPDGKLARTSKALLLVPSAEHIVRMPP